MVSVSETWTGTNGTAWQSPWNFTGNTGTVADILGNQGRLVAGTTPYDAARAWYATAADLNITFTVVVPNPIVESYVVFAWRGDDWASSVSANPNNGYNLEMGIQSNGLDFYATINNVRTYLASPGFTYTAGTNLQVRVTATGSLHTCKLWVGSEPTTGGVDGLGNQISVADPTYLGPGQFGLGFANGLANGIQLFDDFTGTYTTTPSTPWKVQDIGTQVSNAAATTTVISFVGATKPQIGDLVVVYGARNDLASDPLTGDSFSDGTANSYTRLVDGSLATTAALDGVVGVMFYCVLTVAWAGGTNTLTWTHGSLVAAMSMQHWARVASLRSSASNVSAAGAPSVALAGFQTGDLALAMEAIEYSTAGTSTPDTDTTSGVWSPMAGPTATTGTTLAAVKVISQYKLVTANSTQTYNPTHSVTASVDTVAIIAAFVPTAPAVTFSPPPRRLGIPLALLTR